MKRIGIKDLMDSQRYATAHIRKALIDSNISGTWEGRTGTQNIYNLVNGNITPKDSYMYIFLSEFLNVPLRTILLRYTTREIDGGIYKGEKLDW